MRFPLYTLAYGALAVAAAPVYLVKGLTSGKYLWSLPERLALTGVELPPKSAPRIWIHALSLGEVTASQQLITGLIDEGREIVFSTTTRSGFQAAARHWPGLPRFCLPLDLPPAINRRLGSINPDLFVLVETDIWPNLLAGLKKNRLPAVLINARISPRSLAGYRRIKSFWGRVLNLFTAIGCQTEVDRDRLLLLGARPDKVRVLGNLKFDRPAPSSGPEARRLVLRKSGLPDGIWLIAGSTHDGEEDVLLSLFKRLSNQYPDGRLLLAPRNPKRFETVWRLIKKSGLTAARRTGAPPDSATRIFLLDTLGELEWFYELGDLVFVGKSLPGRFEGGGHNLLEPARRSKPVLFGPRMDNFKEIANLLSESGGGRQVSGAGELTEIAAALLADPVLRQDMGRRARQAVESHRGALKRTLTLLDQVLKKQLP